MLKVFFVLYCDAECNVMLSGSDDCQLCRPTMLVLLLQLLMMVLVVMMMMITDVR